MAISDKTVCTGRCYCGATTFTTTQAPQTVSYCHCIDCRRVTGAPVASIAEFDEAAVVFSPDEGRKVQAHLGVTRTFCATCGSPLTGRFDYLPGQVYIQISLLDQAEDYPPVLHTYDSERLSWLHIDDGIERLDKTGRAQMGGTKNA